MNSIQINKQLIPNPKILPDQIIGKIITLKIISLYYLNDYYSMFSPKVQKRINVSSAQATYANTKKFLTKKIKLLQKNELIFYFIFDNFHKKLIGKIEIRSFDHPKGQLGVWINENYWGNGRYKESLELISNLYFYHTNMLYYTAQIHENNLRSLFASIKHGFKFSGQFIIRGNRRYYNMYMHKKFIQ